MNPILKGIDRRAAKPAIAAIIKSISLLITAVCILCVQGCAWERVAEISVPPVRSSQFDSKNLTTSEAVQLLRDVAAQNAFEVRGPIREPTNYGSISVYSALPTRDSSMRARVEMYISDRTTVFQCVAYDLNTLRKITLPLKGALDKRGFRYSVSETTANPLNR